MPEKISQDSTIATVWPHLNHQREYVAGVRHKLMTCHQMNGNAFVRIGVMGTGQQPCYRIFYHTNNEPENIYGSFRHDHKELGNEFAINTNWSIASMSFGEVDDFLRTKVTGRKKA